MPNRRAFIAGAVGTALASAAGASAAKPPRHRVIACEESFLIPEILAENARAGSAGIPLITSDGPMASAAQALVDIGEGRIRSMDRDGIDMQLLMLSSPGVQVFDRDKAVALAALVNDRAAAACVRHPERLAALAAIAPQDPAAAARELDRAVNRLGLKGAVINSHTNNEYLDAVKFWPIFESAEALGVPIYLHPREPSLPMRAALEGPAVSGAAWAYAVETGTHALRIIGAGVFDRFPRLQLVLGHMGEALPFWLPRIDNRYLERFGTVRPPIKRLPSDYIRENFHITSSGMNYPAQLRMTIDVMGIDRTLFAVDYPFEKQSETMALAKALPLRAGEAPRFFEHNAVRLFRLDRAQKPD